MPTAFCLFVLQILCQIHTFLPSLKYSNTHTHLSSGSAVAPHVFLHRVASYLCDLPVVKTGHLRASPTTPGELRRTEEWHSLWEAQASASGEKDENEIGCRISESSVKPLGAVLWSEFHFTVQEIAYIKIAPPPPPTPTTTSAPPTYLEEVYDPGRSHLPHGVI